MTTPPIFYKATRPDGTDFYAGSVGYAALTGTDTALPELPGGECCGPGVYHASTVAAETLIGGSWPCRLFEVTGDPVSEGGHKRGFRTLRVLREIDAHLALGPNGAAVAELIERTRVLSVDEISRLAAARAAAWDAARAAAGDAALALIVRDLITAEQFDVLTKPWRDAVGATWDHTTGQEQT